MTPMISSGLQIRLLGPLAIERNGAHLALPRSRKVRALLALLALEPRPLSRSELCDLLWDVPNDPRGELRWCLSKLRAVLDDPDRRRVVTPADQISLDLSDCRVDALQAVQASESGLARASMEHLRELGEQCAGELLEGTELDTSSAFSAWLVAQRQRQRALHTGVLSELVARLAPSSDEAFRHIGTWLRLAPFDREAHRALLARLLDCGRLQDAEAHLASTLRVFAREGQETAPLQEAWGLARGVAVTSAAAAAPPAQRIERVARRRASIAILPFADQAAAGFSPALGASDAPRTAEGLTDDIITRLAKLRVLFVIARGSVYALAERGLAPRDVGRLLGVEYVVSGSLRRQRGSVSVRVELAETESSRVVWSDELRGSVDDTFSVLDAIVDRIVASIAEEIEADECRRALLAAPASLDAWQAYHRGLWHMYRFNATDNAAAARFFRSAVELDATFSRALAGLSFTHFQNAFLDLTDDRPRQIALALETARQSLSADDRDPAAHWAFGRALWLARGGEEALVELRRSVELSPNFALGHYTLGFVSSQSGDPQRAIEATDYSRQLSPFDPLQFAMLASRALAHVRLGQLQDAAEWAVQATARPNAHTHILAVAAQCLCLAGRREQAVGFVARIRERVPGYGIEDFLRAFRFDAETGALFRSTAARLGL